MAHTAEQHEHSKIVPIPSYSQPYGQAGGQAALKAGSAFLSLFDNSTISRFVFDWTSENRTKWSNLPGGIVMRPGISLGDMSEDQRDALFEFLASSLGSDGYNRLANLLAAEAFLSQNSNAARYGWFPENYWISFYGIPSNSEPWGWQFGGHHLGLNISIRDGQVITMSPTFLGTEPAVFTLDGIQYASRGIRLIPISLKRAEV